MADTVNGSLWTLRYEVRAYAFLLLTWWVAERLSGGKWFRWLVLALACVGMLAHLQALRMGSIEASNWRLYAMFATGGALYMIRSRVPLTLRWGIVGLLALALSLVSTTSFGFVYSLALPYVVIWLAYAPVGVLANYNHAGDYSYGTYIYAFPIQQAIANVLPGVGVASLLCLSSILTLAFAFASWNLVEKPAMAMKAGRRPRARQPQALEGQ
jgi:peptidoglycan/LPS O-acetylase OafA/YrhL